MLEFAALASKHRAICRKLDLAKLAKEEHDAGVRFQIHLCHLFACIGLIFDGNLAQSKLSLAVDRSARPLALHLTLVLRT